MAKDWERLRAVGKGAEKLFDEGKAYCDQSIVESGKTSNMIMFVAYAARVWRILLMAIMMALVRSLTSARTVARTCESLNRFQSVRSVRFICDNMIL